MTLTTLPDIALELILGYVGDGLTLRNLEKTCRCLKTAVEDDTVWAVPSPIVMLVNGVPQESDDWAEDTRFASNRERACVSENLLALRLEQECTSNILIEELGTDGYTLLAQLVLGEHYVSPDVVIGLREDTLETLAELVQHGIVVQLHRSLTLVTFGEGRGYPTVTLTSIEQQAELAGMLECLPSSRGQVLGPLEVELGRDEVNWVNERLRDVGIGEHTRDRVIRRLSYRAGIPKMSNNAYTFVWETILHLTLKILQPACAQHIDYYYDTWDEEEIENSHEKIIAKTKVQSWRMARYVTHNLCQRIKDDNGNRVEYVVMTPVPGTLEESSARLGLPRKVYSVLGDPSSIAAVQDSYEVTEDIMAIEYEDDGNESGFIDLCGEEEDEESDFSVYSDTEEEMMSTSDDFDEALEAFPRLLQDYASR
jgi:hypothetical protein